MLTLWITDGGVFEVAGYRTEVLNFATMKMLTPKWHQIFLRAIAGKELPCHETLPG